MSDTRFAVVYASPLKRALWTGQAVQEAQSEPKPPLETSLLLREQHWGVAEGEPWQWGHTAGLSLEEHFAKQLYPVLHERWQKFPEGESLDDLFTRAKQAIDELIMPHVWSAAREGKKGIHIAIASHGLCISELVPALVMKDESGVHPGEKFRGLQNTAWTRVTVDVKVSPAFHAPLPGTNSHAKGAKEGEPLDFPDNDPPKLQVRVTDFNRHEHLDAVVSLAAYRNASTCLILHCRNVRKEASGVPATILSSRTFVHSLAERRSQPKERQLTLKKAEARVTQGTRLMWISSNSPATWSSLRIRRQGVSYGIDIST